MGREARVPREAVTRLTAGKRRKKDNTWSAAEFAGQVMGRLLKKPAPKEEDTPTGTPDTLSIPLGD